MARATWHTVKPMLPMPETTIRMPARMPDRRIPCTAAGNAEKKASPPRPVASPHSAGTRWTRARLRSRRSRRPGRSPGGASTGQMLSEPRTHHSHTPQPTTASATTSEPGAAALRASRPRRSRPRPRAPGSAAAHRCRSCRPPSAGGTAPAPRPAPARGPNSGDARAQRCRPSPSGSRRASAARAWSSVHPQPTEAGGWGCRGRRRRPFRGRRSATGSTARTLRHGFRPSPE